MPRTKGSKNKKSLTVDYAALIAEKQAEKDAAANEIAAVAANIEELKAELKSKKNAAKKLDKELAKLVANKYFFFPPPAKPGVLVFHRRAKPYATSARVTSRWYGLTLA